MINHVWQSTWYALAAGLLTLALRKNRAQVRYWIWFSASVKFLVPFAVLISLGTLIERPPANNVQANPVLLKLDQFSQPFDSVAFASQPSQAPVDWMWIVCLSLWACGFAVIAVMRIRGWVMLRSAIRDSAPSVLNIPLPIEVRSAARALEPSVVGWWRATLLLPEGIEQRLTPAQLQAVIIHELTHVRRRDNLTSAIHMMVEAIFWFHPLVWWIGARMLEERERACDEAVLSIGSAPADYAEGILSVCKLYLESPLRSAAGVTGSDLKKRIQAVLANRAPVDLSTAKKTALAVTTFAALAAPVFVGMTHVSTVRAQSNRSAQRPVFEVASIRPCSVDGFAENGGEGKGGPKGGLKQGRGGQGPSPGRLNFCAPLQVFLLMAYFPQGTMRYPDFIQAGPAWIKSDRYQINAKTEAKVSSAMMQGPMLQVLLEDRFKLKVHRETREVPGYALVVAKGGVKMPRIAEGSCIPLTPDFNADPPPIEKICGPQPQLGGMKGPNRVVHIHGYTLAEFAMFVSGMTYGPVIDKTGIAGRFDFHLEFAPDDVTPGFMARVPDAGAAPEPGSISFFTALQELGLKLEGAKGTRDFIVIDHVERPTEN